MNRALTIVALTLVVTPGCAASASAQAPAPSPGIRAAATPGAAPTAPATTVPRSGALSIRVDHPDVLVKSDIVVRGTVTPYVARQKVTVRVYRDGKKVKVKAMSLTQDGKVGRFALRYASPTLGAVTVTAAHAQTDELVALRARLVSVALLPRQVGPGSTAKAIRILQFRLKTSGYVVGRRGSFDARTERAVVAFRKVTGMARAGRADAQVMQRIANGGGTFKVKFPKHGRHVEADISRQVLALIGPGGKVERIYPTSSGAPATPTILGSFQVYRKDYGTNAKGMVHSSYFIRGYAIHGYQSVPVYNASHGCLRVPVPDASSIFGWVRYGTRVDTYR